MLHGQEPCQKFKAGICPFNSKCLFNHTLTPVPSVIRPPTTASPEGPHTESTQEFPSLPAPAVASMPRTTAEYEASHNNIQSEASHTNTQQVFRPFPTTGDKPQENQIMEIVSMMAQMLPLLNKMVSQMGITSQ